MCQLFAVSSNAPVSVTFSFTGFSARGGATGEHADGFGLAFHEDAACRLFVDEGPAHDAPLAHFLRSHPIRSRLVVGHIRKATQGPVALANCHPFVREWRGRHWSFSHNGDLRGFRPRLGGRFRPVGSTDSEHAFCWLMQQLNLRLGRGSSPATWREVAPVLAGLAAQAGAHGAFNFVLSDGRVLYAHAATRLSWLQRRHPFPTAHLVDRDLVLDLAAGNGPGDRMALVVTEPLTRNEPWLPVEPGQLLVFAEGEEICRFATQRRTAPRPAESPLLGAVA